MKEIKLSGSDKKILILSSEFPPGPGGIGNHGYNLAKYLSLKNTEVSVLTISDFANKESENKFDEVQNFRIHRFKRYNNKIKTSLYRIKTIRETLDNNNFTHIIFSGRFSLYTSFLLKKYKSKLKFIAIAHGGDVYVENKFEQLLIKRALSRMDLIIPVSNYSKSKLPEGLDSKKINVIPNGFDLENINEIKINTHKILSGELNLVTVGTVWPRKGHHNVLKAFPEILKKYSNVRYSIIGRLADLSKVNQYSNENYFKEKIKLHGQIQNKELYKVLNESDIFMMLSESQSSGDFEGFGIAVIEANYFGLPAIGSKNSGLEDAINNGVSGIIVDPKNSKEICDAIETIVNNYKEFSEGAKKWSTEHHWSKIINRYIKAIDNIN